MPRLADRSWLRAPPKNNLKIRADLPLNMTGDTVRVRSHQLLGSGMEMSLATVHVLVKTESSVLSDSPKVDMLLVQREGRTWNDAQRARLPDGVRDSAAANILVEFKYTESVTEDGLLQAAAYDLFYRRAQRLAKEQALPVVLSAKTPQKSRLAKWGYEEWQRGVYRSSMPILRRVMLLALNRLPPRSNNAYVKLFASREQEREAAFASLDKSVLADSVDMHAYVLGLRQTLNVKGELDMAEVLTPEKVLEYGKKIRQLIFETGTREERLAGLSPDEVMPMFSPEERLAGLNAEERQILLRLLQEETNTDAKGEAGRNGDAA